MDEGVQRAGTGQDVAEILNTGRHAVQIMNGLFYSGFAKSPLLVTVGMSVKLSEQ